MKMKKIVTVLLTVCFLLALVGCGAKNPLVGTWRAVKTSSHWPDIMTLREDGTGVGDGVTINWSADGKLFKWAFILDSREGYYKFKSGKLYIYYDEECTDIRCYYEKN